MKKKEIEFADWDVLTLVYNLPRTIRFARIRCMPREEIIKEVLKGESDDMEAYAYRLGELGLSPSEFEYLEQRMLELAQETENAPPQRRLVVDKSLLRLVRLLPKELAARFVAPYLDHPLKTRRKWAYAILRDMPISELDAARLAEVYRKTGDEDLITFSAP